VAGEAGGIGRIGQPAGEPPGDLGRTDAFGDDVGVEEVLLHELAERGGELVLALDKERGVRNRQAKRTAEQRRHREPVRDAADHGRLGAGLDVAEGGPVRADHGHGDEDDGHYREESGRAPACGGQPPHPQLHRFAPARGYRSVGRRRGRVHRSASGRVVRSVGSVGWFGRLVRAGSSNGESAPSLAGSGSLAILSMRGKDLRWPN
jgi:hypothetical protein